MTKYLNDYMYVFYIVIKFIIAIIALYWLGSTVVLYQGF